MNVHSFPIPVINYDIVIVSWNYFNTVLPKKLESRLPFLHPSALSCPMQPVRIKLRFWADWGETMETEVISITTLAEVLEWSLSWFSF
jgi:hypothetical protein